MKTETPGGLFDVPVRDVPRQSKIDLRREEYERWKRERPETEAYAMKGGPDRIRIGMRRWHGLAFTEFECTVDDARELNRKLSLLLEEER